MRVSNGKQTLPTLKVIKFLREEMGVKKIRFPEHCGIGIKPCSEEGANVWFVQRSNTQLLTIVTL